MPDIGEVWQLRRGDVLLGEITITEPDWPWLYGRFVAEEAFEAVASLFAEELTLSQVINHDDSEEAVDAWEAAYGQISETLTLISPTGRPVAEYLLHIDGDNAWFRWDDEPFNE